MSLARALIADYRDSDDRDAGGIIDGGRQLDRVPARSRNTDPDIAAECDNGCWEPDGPPGGDDLGLADRADADGDDEPGLLTLPDWIEHQARQYQALATAAVLMLGNTLRELAAPVRPTGAATPAVAMDRLATLDDAALWPTAGRPPATDLRSPPAPSPGPCPALLTQETRREQPHRPRPPRRPGRRARPPLEGRPRDRRSGPRHAVRRSYRIPGRGEGILEAIGDHDLFVLGDRVFVSEAVFGPDRWPIRPIADDGFFLDLPVDRLLIVN